jgi:hypothetical protein
MRVLLQLIREFWLPLLLGIAWTAFNFIDRPFRDWSVREVVNVLAPTFFFISWLVAQWYRVRKQQRVEDDLGRIQRDVRALHAPLFPCGLFLSLRMEASDDDLSALFQDAAGFRAFSPDKPIPPPPVGLPPGMAEGRVFHQNGYIEYSKGAVAAAGFFKQEHPGYNVFHRQVRHTVSALPREAVADARSRNHPLMTVPSVRLNIAFSKASRSVTTMRLVDAPKTSEIGDVMALDNIILVDHAFKLVADPAHQPQNWNVEDLKQAQLRFELRFFFVDGVSILPPKSWPAIHNLQLWLGPRGDKVFAFKPALLSSQVVREDPNPIATGHAKCVQLVYEFTVDEMAYAECLLASA